MRILCFLFGCGAICSANPSPGQVTFAYPFYSVSSLVISGMQSAMASPLVNCFTWDNVSLPCTWSLSANANHAAYSDVTVTFTGSSSGQVLLTGTQTFKYYVDSVNGSDGNNGLSAASPFANVTAIPALIAGDCVGLAIASYWRQQLLSSTDNVCVGAYGTGRMPILDASDIITNSTFTQNGTYPAVYQTNWTPTTTGENLPQFFENGILLTRVADIASVAALKGSFYSSTTNAIGVPQPLYFQSVSGLNPKTDGNVYEISVRDSGLNLTGLGVGVFGVHTKNNLHKQGSLFSGGTGGYISNSLAENGTIHNMFVGSGIVVDSMAWKADKYMQIAGGGGGVMFIGYQTSLTSQPIMWVRDTAVGTTGDNVLNAYAGFHSHGGASGYGAIIFQDCGVYNASAGFDADNNASMSVYRSFTFETDIGITINGSIPFVVSGYEFYHAGPSGVSTIGIRPSSSLSSSTISNYIFNSVRGAAFASNLDWSLTVTNSVFHAQGATPINVFDLEEGAGAGTITMNHDIFSRAANAFRSGVLYELWDSLTLVSDYNIIDNTLHPNNSSYALFHIAGTEYSPEGYRASFPTEDVHSLLAIPGWAGNPNSRNYNLTGGSNAGSISAGLSSPPLVIGYSSAVDRAQSARFITVPIPYGLGAVQ